MPRPSSLAKTTIAALSKGLEDSSGKIAELEKQLGEERRNATRFAAELQRRLARFSGVASTADTPAARSGSVIGNARTKRGLRSGSLGEAIVTALKGSSKPLTADEVLSAIGGKSKPSVSQTLMKLVQAGAVQRFNSEGKTIAKNDKTQRARGYGVA